MKLKIERNYKSQCNLENNQATYRELKSARSYESQLDRFIEDHNLTVTDRKKAIDILKHVNYYRLSAYGIGLKKPDNEEEYIDGISLNHIYRLYYFDSSLRNHLIHLIEQLEIQLRTQISYHLAMNYGPEGYMDASNFSDKTNKHNRSIHEIIISNFRKECDRQKNLPFVKHHNQEYGGHFPIWVATELFTFGNLSSLYSILKINDKKEIASLYDTKPEYLTSWILAMVELRNICAHYSRLYNMPLKQKPRLYSEHRKYYSSSRLNKLFPTLIVLKRMTYSSGYWTKFENQLNPLMKAYNDVIKLSFIGFPRDWENVLKNVVASNPSTPKGRL